MRKKKERVGLSPPFFAAAHANHHKRRIRRKRWKISKKTEKKIFKKLARIRTKKMLLKTTATTKRHFGSKASLRKEGA
jgi:hypothetical protein